MSELGKILREFSWVLALVLFLCLVGCGLVEDMEWEDIKDDGTISDYQDFLRKYPVGIHAEEARAILKKYQDEIRLEFRNVKRVKILVEDSCEGKEVVNLPLAADIKKFLEKYIGLNVVKADAKEYDAILRIQAEGHLEGAKQGQSISIYNTSDYSGALLKGIISLKIPEGTTLKKTFQGYVNIAECIKALSWRTKDLTPYNVALKKSGSYWQKLYEIIIEAYGANIVLDVLRRDPFISRESAKEALANVGKPVVNSLIDVMKNKGDEFSRLRDEDVQEILAAIGEPAVESLIDVFRSHADNLKRMNAAWVLGEIGDKRAIRVLIPEMDHPDPYLRYYTTAALAKIKYAGALENLFLVLKSNDPVLRRRTAAVLGKIKDKRALEPLIEAARDESWEVRMEAVYALGRIGDNGAVETLINALQDDNWQVRQWAAWALAKFQDDRAIEALISALNDKNLKVRLAAAEFLGDIRDWRAIEPLIEQLKDKHLSIGQKAADSLEEITKQPLGNDYDAWSKWWRENKHKYQPKEDR